MINSDVVLEHLLLHITYYNNDRYTEYEWDLIMYNSYDTCRPTHRDTYSQVCLHVACRMCNEES